MSLLLVNIRTNLQPPQASAFLTQAIPVGFLCKVNTKPFTPLSTVKDISVSQYIVHILSRVVFEAKTTKIRTKRGY